MGVLSKLEPAAVFNYFEEICGIPHGSGNVKKIGQYLMDFAKKHGLSACMDETGNVIIVREASKGMEACEPYIIQGHMDMVAVKDADCGLDLEQEGLSLKVDGDYIYADKTSLGADDGIAVAYAMALLSDTSLKTPRIEAVFTVDEEVGMEGATAVDLSDLKGNMLINIDSEEEGILLTSCAGGMRIESRINLLFTEKTGYKAKIEVSGLLGGHSGQEINNGRINANVMLGRILFLLKQQEFIALISLSGGEKDNVIPNRAMAEILINESEGRKAKEIVERQLAEMEENIKNEYGSKEPGVKISFYCEENISKEYVMSEDSIKAVLDYISLQPNGVQKMSASIEGLVETSLNMGVIGIEGNTFVGTQCLRSSVLRELEMLRDKVMFITKECTGNAVAHGVYPPWEYKEDSKLREIMIKAYKDMFGKEPLVEAIHAGLECGILASKKPGLDCISFGPDMYDIHTTKERLSISSTKRMWEYLVKIVTSAQTV